MQQLIDKQVLLQALKRKRYSKQSLDLIESQPVVDAIPVDWVIAYYKYRLMPRPVQWFEAIQIMIEDWEKENEGSVGN